MKNKDFIVQCSGCRKIRINDLWVENLDRIDLDTHENVSHTICFECAKIYYPEYADLVKI